MKTFHVTYDHENQFDPHSFKSSSKDFGYWDLIKVFLPYCGDPKKVLNNIKQKLLEDNCMDLLVKMPEDLKAIVENG